MVPLLCVRARRNSSAESPWDHPIRMSDKNPRRLLDIAPEDDPKKFPGELALTRRNCEPGDGKWI